MKKLQLLIFTIFASFAAISTPKYAALHDGMLTPAPSMLWPNPAPPTESEYNTRGFYRVIDIPPYSPAPEGCHWEGVSWSLQLETGKVIRRIYEAVEDPPPPPKTYQTADVIEALMAHEVWPQCRAWIEEQGLLDLVFTTPTFADDLPNFVAARQGLQQLLGWSDAQVEALLEEASSESSEAAQ